jgi:hypothetical protein
MQSNNLNIEAEHFPRDRGRGFQAVYQEIYTKHLSNGTTISKMQKGTICRDSFGRERKEFTQIENGMIETIAYLHDPVNKLQYLLETTTKTIIFETPVPQDGFRARTWSLGDSAIAIPLALPSYQPHFETKEVEGLVCTGYYINQPDNYKIEYWYSSDLGEIMLAKIASDSEQIIWRLFNIKLEQPDANLFVVPTDYHHVQ